MKRSVLIPAGLCIAAGLLLSADAVCGYFSGHGSSMGAADHFDIFSFAVGLYFIGKGFFIHALLTKN
jgi:hypothetical protein